MKAPPRPVSQKRAAEGLLGRVRLVRLYVLSQAAGTARRSNNLPLRTTSNLRAIPRSTHTSTESGVFATRRDARLLARIIVSIADATTQSEAGYRIAVASVGAYFLMMIDGF